MTLQTISSGVVSSGLTVSSGDELRVLSGGTASATTVLSGGTERLSAGARADGVMVADGGALIGPGRGTDVDDFGLVSGVTIIGELDVESGGVASGNIVRNDELVFSGGFAVGEVIFGTEEAGSGAETIAASVRSGGEVIVDPGSVAIGEQVSSGGILIVAGSAVGDVVSSGGAELYVSGAIVRGDTVLSGGLLGFNGNIKSGQTLTIGASVASPMNLAGVALKSGAILELEEAKILSGGTVSLTAGAENGPVIVAAGGALLGDGAIAGGADLGLMSGVFVEGPSTLFVEGKGVASAVTIGSGAAEVVLAGGQSLGAVIGSDGIEVVSSGAVVSGDVIQSGGVLQFDERILAGASITIGASVTSTTVFEGETLLSGAQLQLEGATLLSGATVSLQADAPPVIVRVRSGAVLQGPGPADFIDDLGLLSGVTVSGDGFVEVVGHGVTSGDVISDGGLEAVFGGQAIGDVIGSAGLMQVNFGQASGAIVSQGGLLQVFGGIASGTQVLGGIETIQSKGVASGTVISGGYEFDFGLAVGTLVQSGGHEKVANGAIASDSVIASGGAEGVASGGVAAGATISGGTLVVSSGGTISGDLTIEAGRATVSGTMAAGETVSFTGGAGALELDNLTGFQAAISGFSTTDQRIDLGGFAFGGGETLSWTQSGTSGTLTVQDGGQSASLTLIGTYTARSFHLLNDAHGGTAIRGTAPPPVVPATTRFVQAAAGVEGGRSAAGVAAIHGRGSALIGTSPLVGVATSGR